MTNSMKNILGDALAPLHLLQHPFYRDWMAGKLSRAELLDYAGQYLAHVEAFPRYVSAAHSMATQAQHRNLLLQNLNEEEGFGHGEPHPELWRQFARGVGLSEAELERLEAGPAVKHVMTTFFRLARSSFHEGIGALYAYESQVPEIAASKIEGLRAHYGVRDTATLRFFQVHKTADQYHREALEKILDGFSEKEKAEAVTAAKEAAKALWDFLSSVHKPGHAAA